MILTLATPQDREAVNLLAVQVHDLHVSMQPQYFLPMDCLYSDDRFQKAISEDALYVAKADGLVIGYALISQVETNHPGVVAAKSLRIEELCVAAGYRHRGIGRAMMEDLKSIAEKRGCTDLRLTCAPQNIAANRFYESLGMEIKTIQYCIQL